MKHWTLPSVLNGMHPRLVTYLHSMEMTITEMTPATAKESSFVKTHLTPPEPTTNITPPATSASDPPPGIVNTPPGVDLLPMTAVAVHPMTTGGAHQPGTIGAPRLQADIMHINAGSDHLQTTGAHVPAATPEIETIQLVVRVSAKYVTTFIHLVNIFYRNVSNVKATVTSNTNVSHPIL